VAKDEQFDPQAVTKARVEKMLAIQQPLAVEEVARLRRVNPDKSPAELSSYRNRSYLREVRRIGAAAGLAGTGQRAPGDPREFQQASALYVLTVAELHRLHPEDFERRTQLLEFVLTGNVLSRATTSEPVMSRTVPHLSKKILDSIPMSAINRANRPLGPRFATKRGTVQGKIVLEQILPHVIGVGIGAGGYHLSGCFVIMTAKKILDPAAASWDDPQSSDTGSSS
jgi:hypothetical protein